MLVDVGVEAVVGGCEDGLRSASGGKKNLGLQDRILGDVDECEDGRGKARMH